MTGRQPTLSDVARKAQVSYATADRFVNGRGAVAEKSARRVQAAIDELGYVRNVAAANLSTRRTYRFGFVLPQGDNAFFHTLRDILDGAVDRLQAERIEIRIEEAPAFDPAALARRLADLGRDGFDGLAVVGNDDDRVRGALSDLRERGVHVISLVTDVHADVRDGYVGVDNLIVGRTAGRLLALAHGGRAGRVLPVIGARSARDHAERLAGAEETLASLPVPIPLVPAVEGLDRADTVQRMVRDALAADPAITAIYSAGAGNAGLVRVLRDIAPECPRPVAVLHELNADTRSALTDGVIDIVIDQRPEEEVMRALHILRCLADRKDPGPSSPIVPAIFVKDNLPPERAATPSKGMT